MKNDITLTAKEKGRETPCATPVKGSIFARLQGKEVRKSVVKIVENASLQ